jgi:protocatechuate 4,5-dioxygenase alpha chain
MQIGKFDERGGLKGYALNKMCFSFNEEAARKAFLADEDGYCAKFRLNAEEREAVKSRDKKKLQAAGGNTYFLAKFDRVLRQGGEVGWRAASFASPGAPKS